MPNQASQTRSPLSELEQIQDVCHGIRSIFEKVLQEALPGSSTAGTCLHASALLLQSIQQFSPVRFAYIYGGGEPGRAEGLLAHDGQWYGHYWVQGACESGIPFIADITADQFGLPKVIVASPEDAWFHHYWPDAVNPVLARTAEEALAIAQ